VSERLEDVVERPIRQAFTYRNIYDPVDPVVSGDARLEQGSDPSQRAASGAVSGRRPMFESRRGGGNCYPGARFRALAFDEAFTPLRRPVERAATLTKRSVS